MSNNYSSMGKRRFLRTMATLGVSATALRYLSQDSLATLTDNPEEEVPRLSRVKFKNPKTYSNLPIPDEPPKIEPVFYTIPRDEWVHVESTFGAANRLRKHISRHFDASGRTSVSVADFGTGNTSDLGLRVLILDNTWEETESTQYIQGLAERLSSRLPSSVSGDPTQAINPELGIGQTTPHFDTKREDIPVEVTSVEMSQTASFNHKYRPVPGGCQIWDENFLGGDVCTSGTPIYSSMLGKHVLLTAAHCYDSVGDAAEQPSYTSPITKNHIGNVHQRKKFGTFDVATVNVDINEYSNVIYRLACNFYDDCYGVPIRGFIGKDELKDHIEDPSYIIRKQGRTTGITKGTVSIIEEATYGNNNPVTRLWVNANADGGDSGGPHFRLIDEVNGIGAYIAGIHAWTGGGMAVSTTMTSILSDMDVDWI